MAGGCSTDTLVLVAGTFHTSLETTHENSVSSLFPVEFATVVKHLQRVMSSSFKGFLRDNAGCGLCPKITRKTADVFLQAQPGLAADPMFY